VSIKNQKGKPLINISLLLALILVIAAPQILLAVLIGVALEIIDVEYDGQELGWDGLG
jgi:type III secretory pathway component EscS